MKRSTCIIASIGCLLSGIIVGASFNGWAPSNSLQAKSPIYLTADETYAKLSQTDSPILQGSERIAEVSRLTMPSVVHIQCVRHVSGRTVEETGSGVIIRNDTTKARGTFVVTNLHVIRGTPRNEIHIRLYDGRELQPLQVWSDERSDIAVMKVEADNLQAARWGNSEVLDIGHMVLALGSPFGLSQSVTFGIVSAKSRRSLNLGKESRILNQNFLQTDAAINPGNSGGPLVNLRGEIVGINTAIASSSGGNEGIGFSIPSSLVRRVVRHLLEYGQVRRAYIGVRLNEDFDIDVARKLKLDRVRGAHVLIVYPNTPASDANLQREDVILSVDNVDVHDLNHLINLISLKEIGTSVNLVVFRDGKRVRAELKVVDLDRSQRSAEMSTPVIPNKESPKVDLGLSLQPLDDSLADQLGYGMGTAGLLVLNVDADGPLAAADLQLYDVIEEVSRKSVDSVDAFQTALKTGATEPLVLKVRRQTNGKSTSHLVLMKP